MKRTRLLIGSIFGLVIFLSVVQVTASNRISTTGIELAKLQNELRDVKRQNTLLREKILSQSSLTEIASKAGELGFVEAKNTVFISHPLPIARN
jgi:cell division protein FtsL